MLIYSALTVVAVAALLIAESRESRVGKWIAKPLASTGFVAAALAGGALASSYGCIVLVALGFCWLGDVLLISRARASFLAGIGTFLLGHVGFVVAFAERAIAPRAILASGLLLAVPALIALRWLRPHVPGPLWLPVVVYLVVITVMVAVSAGTWAHPRGALMFGGAVLFYASDLSVARDRFVAPGFANKLWGLPLYYASTLVLGASISPPTHAG